MNSLLWFRVLLNVFGPLLDERGRGEQRQFLEDALAAAEAGKNVDSILADAAERWRQNGPPSVDDLAADRQRIQDLMG